MELRWIEDRELFKNESGVRISTLRANFPELSALRIEDISDIRVSSSSAVIPFALIGGGFLISVLGIGVKVMKLLPVASPIAALGLMIALAGLVLLLRQKTSDVEIAHDLKGAIAFCASDSDEALAIVNAVKEAQALRSPK